MRLPAHFKQPVPDSELLKKRKLLFSAYRINTVCRSAGCPNLAKCLKDNTATFMILGNICSRQCLFCAVEKGSPEVPDNAEPYHIAQVVKEMGLDYVVITSVCRDDLSDFGVGQFIKVVDSVRILNPDTKIELLIPDFSGDIHALERVVNVSPDCIGHNLEVVARLYPELNRVASYERSLWVISAIKKINSNIYVKSGIMLGLGEEKNEVTQALKDLKRANCDIVTIGQYLAPSRKHFPVKRFLAPGEFEEYRRIAQELGFKKVLSGPRVRSSYRARQVYWEIKSTPSLSTNYV